MDAYVVKSNQGISVCSHPFVEKLVVPGSNGGVVGEKVEVTEDEMKKAQSKDFKAQFSNGKFAFDPVEQKKSDKELRREELRQKAKDGTLKSEEIMEALALIL